jgi:hypothetical protein
VTASPNNVLAVNVFTGIKPRSASGADVRKCCETYWPYINFKNRSGLGRSFGMVDIRQQAPLIRSGVKVHGQTNFAEALALVFEDTTISDTIISNPLTDRLNNILAASADSFNNGMSHFSGIFADWTDGTGESRRGDTGFKPVFQDFPLWPGSSMQVGHFMTAVHMGFEPHKLYQFVNSFLDPDTTPIWGPPTDPGSPLRPGWWSAHEQICVKLIIAHERVPDSGGYGQEVKFWNKLRTFFKVVTETDEDIFRRAFDGLGGGPQHDTDKALGNLSAIKVGNGYGNSKQDLLLSLFGFKFGTMIRKGELTRIAEGGNWVRVNLKEASAPKIKHR